MSPQICPAARAPDAACDNTDMCGIAGLVGSGNGPEARNALARMTCSLARRGPDGEGMEFWPDAALGHRRLAILDLSEAGRQPMLSEDGAVGVVFNGCIYNFLELRGELERQGHRFRSNCDTEVLVQGYREWGADQLARRIRGMFAIGIWDEPRRTLFLIRDRLGVKPLVYSQTGRKLAFASTVQALRAANFASELDPMAVLEFLEFGYITDARSIFVGVSKLPAGSILEWRAGQESTTRRYWALPSAEERSRITFEEAVEETERLLIEAVRLRLQSDVPIGALLSGGIDSTLVCWALAKLNANIATFTVSTPGDAADEAPAARETARLLGVPHQVVTLPAEGSEILGELTRAYGEPFAPQSALAMLRVSRAVKPHATVLLTGDGGDDVFLGYEFHHHYLRAQAIARKLPPAAGPIWRGLIRPAVNLFPRLRRPKHFVDYITGGLGAMTRAHDGLPFYRDRQILGERLSGLELADRQIPLSSASARKLLGEMLEYQQRTWFVSHFLTKVDGATMFHALEARSPFLDHTMWEFAAKLPYELRLRNGEYKSVLREIVRRRISPEIARRGKQGFTIPVEKWLLRDWSAALEPLRENSLLIEAGWLRAEALGRVLDEARRRERLPIQLWFVLVLEKWLRSQAAAAAAPHSVATLT